MARYAIISGGIVANIIAADAAFAASVGAVLAADDTHIGDAWDGSTFSRPAPVVDLAALRAERWEAVKAERERRRAGGTQVGDHWYHSDDSSRIQQLALFVMGAGVPSVQWKTMSGEFVTMTQTLAAAIFTGVAAKDQALFSHAEALRAELDAAEDPGAVDILAGWPAVFGE